LLLFFRLSDFLKINKKREISKEKRKKKAVRRGSFIELPLIFVMFGGISVHRADEPLGEEGDYSDTDDDDADHFDISGGFHHFILTGKEVFIGAEVFFPDFKILGTALMMLGAVFEMIAVSDHQRSQEDCDKRDSVFPFVFIAPAGAVEFFSERTFLNITLMWKHIAAEA